MICNRCSLLNELYGRTPQSTRDYYVITELYVLLHGGDVCHGEIIVPPKQSNKFDLINETDDLYNTLPRTKTEDDTP